MMENMSHVKMRQMWLNVSPGSRRHAWVINTASEDCHRTIVADVVFLNAYNVRH